MRSSSLSLLCFLLLAGVSAPDTLAGDYPVDPLITMNILLTYPGYSGCAELDDGSFLTCEDVQSNHDDTTIVTWTWLFVSKDGGKILEDFPGIGGIQWGFEYDPGLTAQSWTLCTGGNEIPQDDGFGTWPESGTGNAATWTAGWYAPPGESAKAGFLQFPKGQTGFVRVTADPRKLEFGNTTTAIVAACAGAGATISALCEAAQGVAIVGTGNQPVCGNPCGATPIEVGRWSRVKSLF